MRYDQEKGIYQDCRFCHGTGCLACEGEAEKAYKKAFPDGPKPIATFRKDNPEDMVRLKKAFGKAFGANGNGLDELMEHLTESS